MASGIAKLSLLACLVHVASANWTAGEWTKCSAACGNGTQMREVQCPVGVVCDTVLKPVTSMWCRGTQCPWDATRVSGWGSCSNGCGEGLQLSKPACNCPMPCYLPDDGECKDTPLPPNSSWMNRPCFGTLASRPDEYCTNCTASGNSCFACSPGFKLVGGKCEATSRIIRQTLSWTANSQLLSPMSRAVALVKAVEETFKDLANSSTSVVSMESRSTTTTKQADFLTARRLSSKVCKKARIVSRGGELSRASFFFDGKNITSKQETRGFGVVTIDPDTLEVSGTPASFDIYGDSHSVGDLTKHLNELRDGSFVLLGLSDSGLERLDAAALAAFHRIGAAVQGFGVGTGYRQPYAFIGQVGTSSIKEMWDVPEGSTVDVECDLCIEPSVVNMLLVAHGDNNTDPALSSLARSVGNLKAEDIRKHVSAKLGAANVEMPDSAAVGVDAAKAICPDHLAWTDDKCAAPLPSVFPLWAKILLGVLAALLLLCCCAAALFLCCRRRSRGDTAERLVPAAGSSRGLCAPAAGTSAAPECSSRGLSAPGAACAAAPAATEALAVLGGNCPKCGSAYLPDAVFCNKCGHRRSPQAHAPELSIDTKQRCRRAFALIDKNGDRTLSRIEVIKACRESEEVRKLLGLPQVIRSEDGSRAAFEAAFQRLDKDNSKSITYDEFEQAFANDPVPRGSDRNAALRKIEDGHN